MTDLSSAALAATTAVALADDQRRAWFQALCELAPESTSDTLAHDLTTAADTTGVAAGTVEELLRVLECDPDPVGTLAELRAAGPDLLEQAYLAATAEPAAAAEVDERAWTEFLHSHGRQWSREEETWPPFREWFRYEAGQRGLGEPARMFVEYAESRDKAQTFDDYQVPHPAAAAARPAEPEVPDVSAFPEVKEGDEGSWVAYADALLTRAGY